MARSRYSFEQFVRDAALLGLAVDAEFTPTVIRARHRSRIKKAHTDVPGGDLGHAQALNAARDNLLKWHKDGAVRWPAQTAAQAPQQPDGAAEDRAREAAKAAEAAEAARRQEEADRRQAEQAAAEKAAQEKAAQAKAEAEAEAEARVKAARDAAEAGRVRREQAEAAAERKRQDTRRRWAEDDRRAEEEAQAAQRAVWLDQAAAQRRLADRWVRASEITWLILRSTFRGVGRAMVMIGFAAFWLVRLLWYPGLAWSLRLLRYTGLALLWTLRGPVGRAALAALVVGVGIYGWTGAGNTLPRPNVQVAALPSLLPSFKVPSWVPSGNNGTRWVNNVPDYDHSATRDRRCSLITRQCWYKD